MKWRYVQWKSRTPEVHTSHTHVGEDQDQRQESTARRLRCAAETRNNEAGEAAGRKVAAGEDAADRIAHIWLHYVSAERDRGLDDSGVGYGGGWGALGGEEPAMTGL